jgi:hypothetical protein
MVLFSQAFGFTTRFPASFPVLKNPEKRSLGAFPCSFLPAGSCFFHYIDHHDSVSLINIPLPLSSPSLFIGPPFQQLHESIALPRRRRLLLDQWMGAAEAPCAAGRR